MNLASELRIGVSWVYWCGKVPVQFNGTHIYGEGQFSIGNQKTMPQVRYDGYEFYQVAWDDLSPIPITNDIFEKCDFKFSQPDNIFKTGVFRKWDISHYNCIGIIPRMSEGYHYQGSPSASIKYVHQLQNIYMCLAGEELEINL